MALDQSELLFVPAQHNGIMGCLPLMEQLNDAGRKWPLLDQYGRRADVTPLHYGMLAGSI